jgi:hypothetical protein
LIWANLAGCGLGAKENPLVKKFTQTTMSASEFLRSEGKHRQENENKGGGDF